MAKLSRRLLLYQTSFGAAAVGMLPVAARFVAVAPPAAVPEVAAEAEAPTAVLSEPLVAFIHTDAPNVLTLMVGTREIIIRDAALIARLVQAAL